MSERICSCLAGYIGDPKLNVAGRLKLCYQQPFSCRENRMEFAIYTAGIMVEFAIQAVVSQERFNTMTLDNSGPFPHNHWVADGDCASRASEILVICRSALSFARNR